MGDHNQWKPIGKVTTQPTSGTTKRAQVKTRARKTENIIFIGSEMDYDLFWLKMMFVGAAYKFSNTSLRTASRSVVAYVNIGYERAERLAIEGLANSLGAETIAIGKTSDVQNVLARDRDSYELLDVAFFCHGLVGSLDLDYAGPKGIKITSNTFSRVRQDAFSSGGRFFSFACRTGNGEPSLIKDQMGFANDQDCRPEQSLAQFIADHFDIEVNAFLKRSFYGNVLRNQSDSKRIADLLKSQRDHSSGGIIDLPPDHEAIPHPGLADSGIDWPFLKKGPRGEGTNDYSLWRKKGGISIPSSAETPKGLSSGLRKFRKK